MNRAAQIWWQGLARRERVLSATAALVVTFGLIYAIGIEPAFSTRARLASELPRLQAELVQLEALGAEVRTLQASGGAVQSRDSLRAAVDQSILRENLVAEVATQADRAVSVTAGNVSAAKWFQWLEGFVREARVQVVAARVERVTSGKVKANVSFAIATDK